LILDTDQRDDPRTGRVSRLPGAAEISLELKVGKIPVTFHTESDGQVFGEMRQKDPEFGESHARDVVAPLVGLKVDDIADDGVVLMGANDGQAEQPGLTRRATCLARRALRYRR